VRTSPLPVVCKGVKNECFSLRQESKLTVSEKRGIEKNI